MIKNAWDDRTLKEYKNKLFKKLHSDIVERIYTSHLIGNDPDLVMHGGGNISVKTIEKNTIGEDVKTLRIKGSGWDLEKINNVGLPALDIKKLLKLGAISKLSDEGLVSFQRQCLLDPGAPNPSIETLLHAFIPEKFVEHTHSTPFLFLANIKNSKKVIHDLFGDKVAFVPYVKPGFDLALLANSTYRSFDKLEGMFLEHHGHFTWGDTAKESYDRLIKQTNTVEKWIDTLNPSKQPKLNKKTTKNISNKADRHAFIRDLRSSVNQIGQGEYILITDVSKKILDILDNKNLKKFVNRWVLTPDHIIRTKGKPLLFDLVNKSYSAADIYQKVENYTVQYTDYFNTFYKKGLHTMLDPLPFMIWVRGLGVVAVSKDVKSGKIINDLASQTLRVFDKHIHTNKGFYSLPESDLFEMEYWSLEQAKLGKSTRKPLQGKVAVITGGAGTIGKACAEKILFHGGNVVLIDKDKKELEKVTLNFNSDCVRSLDIDITKPNASDEILKFVTNFFGGADILISNAGSAVEGMTDELESQKFRDSFELNFFSHYELAKEFIKFYKHTNNKGQILFNISKQSINPGVNFGAYGIPKLSIIGLMKQLALENGLHGIRVNGINADKIQSGLLTSSMISKRSKARKVSKQDYLTGNLLRSEILADDVADGFMALILSLSKTTGHIITVDGGNIEASLR